MRWVFAYGSLIWRPDFPFVDRRRVRLPGYARRFWQGSHDHRGTPDAPGRVVTLIPNPHAICHGLAYQIEDESVFVALDHREKNGYRRTTVSLHPEDAPRAAFDATAWVAEPGNFAYLGEASIDNIAEQIANSTGPSGRNDDYVFELANALKSMGIDDPHIMELNDALHAISASATNHSEGALKAT